MKTYQDYEQSQNKENFILDAINEFKGSLDYSRALTAKLYFEGENSEILSRRKMFYGKDRKAREDLFKANNRIPSDFFSKIVKQEVSYLLANGLVTEDKIKKKLGRKFDLKLKRIATEACVSKTGWGYAYINNKGEFDMATFDFLELVPLFDERTGALKAAIRFYQIDSEKPMWIEFYTEQGVIKFKNYKSKMTQVSELKPYILKTKTDITGEVIVGSDNWSQLPITPLYCNDSKTSRFKTSLKNKIDLFDIVLSDFGNNLEDSQDVYWVLKNYQGQDIEEFLEDFKYYKSLKVDEDGEATPHTIEVPYEARKTALEILKKQIYDDSMALDTSILAGGSLTNVAIKANMMDLDLKTDDLEAGCIDFCEDIIKLCMEFYNMNLDYQINFIRNKLIDETETIDNLVKSLSSGMLSVETAMSRNPFVEDVKKELGLVDTENLKMYGQEEVIEEGQ